MPVKRKTKGEKIVGAFLSATFLMLCSHSGASAATNVSTMEQLRDCVANTNETECSLQADIEYAETLTISHDLKISGNGHKATRGAGFADSFLSIEAGNEVTIENLNFDGSAPGWEKDLSPEHIAFRFNGAGDRAYGVYNLIPSDGDVLANAPVIDNSGALVIASSSFKNHYNQGSTASVIANHGDLSIADTEFEHNAARANSTVASLDSAAMNATDSSFVNNNAGNGAASANGGALNSAYGDLTVANCYFENNSSANDGGAIYSISGNTSITDSTFVRNSSGNDGSAIKFGRGLNANSTPLEHEGTAVLSGLSFSENINLSTYWIDGAASPNGTAANGNGQGVFAYFNDGYEDITIKDSSFEDDTTGWGVMSFYSCDTGTTHPACITPNYLVENVTARGEDGSIVYAASPGNLTIKGSTFEAAPDVSAVSISRMNDVVIEDTDITGGKLSFQINLTDSATVKNLSIDGGDLAMLIRDTKDVVLDGVTISNSDHHSYPDHYTAGLYGYEHVSITNMNYIDNDDAFHVLYGGELTIDDSIFDSKTGKALNFGSSYDGLDAVVITDTTIHRQSDDGPALYIANKLNDNNSTAINITLGDGVEITGNTNNITEDNEGYASGYGGAVLVIARDNIDLTISENANISGNKASNAGDDIFLYAEGDASTLTANIYGNFFHDNEDDRATVDGEPSLRRIVLRNNETLGLASPAQPEVIPTPDTYDSAKTLLMGFGATSLLGAAIIVKSSKRN